MFGIVFVR